MAWRPDAELVVLTGLEFPANATGFPVPGVDEVPPDELVGDGHMPVWIGGYRDMASDEAIAFAAFADGTVIEVAEQAAALQRLTHPVGAHSVSSVRAWELAAEDGLQYVLDGNDTATSSLLRGPDAALANHDTLSALADVPHWALTAWNDELKALETRFVDATSAEVFAPASNDPDQITVHYHAALSIFVNGTRVTFDDPRYDVSRTGYTQMHFDLAETGDQIVHVEGTFDGQVVAKVRDFLDSLQVRYVANTLRFDQGHGFAQHSDGDGYRWAMYVSHYEDGAWGPYEEQFINPPGYRIQPGDRIYLAFDTQENHRGAQGDALRAAVPFPPTQSES